MSTLTDKINALEDVPDAWAKKIEAFQPKLFRTLTQLMNSLTVNADGFIEMTAGNLQAIETILAGLEQYLTTGEYVQIVGELNQQFIAQQATTVKYFDEAFGSAPVTSFNSTLYNTNRGNAIRAVLGDGLNPMLYTPLRETLLEGIASGSSYSDLLNNVQRIAMGNDELEGNLLRYSRQIVSDSFATTDSEFTKIIGDELGLEWYRYLGGKMKTTRCFCLARNGGYYHRQEIEGWGNLVEIGDCRINNGWQGRYRGTNAETIFTWRGGYNCQHSLLPVSEFSVPKKDAIRAIEKGWYKPDQTAKEHFEL